MLEPNTPIKRFDYVWKTYRNSDQAPILFDVAMVTASLIGDERMVNEARSLRNTFRHEQERLADLSQAAQEIWQESLQRGHPDPDARDAELEELDEERRDLERWKDREYSILKQRADARFNVPRHQYEKLIPWVAAQLNKAYKRQVEGAQPRYRGVLRELHAAAIRGDVQLDDPGHRAVRGQLEGTLANYDEFVSLLVRRITAIGQWAEAERIDIGRTSLEDALYEANRFVEAQREEAEDTEEGDVVWRFDDGYTVQELTTKPQLTAEGEAMGHCVGSYCEAVYSGRSRIYSLRDPQGRPHVTMEWDPNAKEWEQIRGKQNEMPVEKYHPYLDEFLAKHGPGGVKPDERAVEMYKKGDVLRQAEEIGDDSLARIRYFTGGRLEEGASFSYRELDEDEDMGPAVVILGMSEFSDYGGGGLHSKLVFKEIGRMFPGGHPDLHQISGSHGGSGWAIRGASNDEDMLSLLEQFAAYDIETDYELEMEEQEEAWDDWVRDDYVREVDREQIPIEADEAQDRWSDLADVMDGLGADGEPRGLLRSLFEKAREAANEYWGSDGPSAYINITPLARLTTPQLVRDALLDDGRYLNVLVNALQRGETRELMAAARTLEEVYDWGERGEWEGMPDPAKVDKALNVMERLL